MPASSKSPVLRQTFIVIAFLALVGLFFALNLFVIIPRQQQVYHRKVFRVLQEASDDFKRRTEGRADYFAKRDTQLLPAADTGTVITENKLLNAFFELDTTPDHSDRFEKQYRFTTDTVTLTLTDRKEPGARPGPMRDTILIRDVLEPTIQQLHKDIFELVVLAQRDTLTVKEDEKTTKQIQDKVLYEFGELSASYILPGDSLFREPRFGQFSSISDIEIAGTRYKAFTQPFRFASNELMLVGFVKNQSFQLNTERYSKKTLLWILFLLTLFILSLPLVKIYLAGRQEKIRTNDLRMLTVVFVVLPMTVFLIATTLLIYRQLDDKTDQNLRNDDGDRHTGLQKAVETAFLTEIASALKQLQHYKDILAQPNSLQSVYEKNKRFFDAATLRSADFKDILLYPAIYPNANDVFWINDSGMQVAKWFFTKNDRVSYFDVSERNYFKRMRNREVFTLGNDTFYLEPNISWSSGKYSVNILVPCRQVFRSPDTSKDSTIATMIGIGSSLYSVFNPVVPKGYNFGMINEQGEILFHSETGRSLHENLLEESNRNLELLNTIHKKDSALLPDVELFGKPVKLFIKPLDSIPSVFMVSYFNKREQNLFVFHVSAFTLLCISLTLFFLLLSMLLYYFFSSEKTTTAVYQYESAWMKPLRRKEGFYQQNIFLQLCLFLSLMFLFFLVWLFDENQNWYILQASILLPFLILAGYLLLRNELNYQTEKAATNEAPLVINNSTTAKTEVKENRAVFSFLIRNRKELLIYSFSCLFVLLSLNSLHNNLLGIRLVAVFAIVAPCLAMPFAAFQIARLPVIPAFSKKPKGRNSYFTSYTSLISLSILFTSVLPTLGIFSFALQEEKRMWVKAGQFHAAKQIAARRDSLNQYFATTVASYYNRSYIDERKIGADKGIYLLHDTVTYLDSFRHVATVTNTINHSAFYQTITRFLFLPNDHSDFFDNNNSYYWYMDTASRQIPKPANRWCKDSIVAWYIDTTYYWYKYTSYYWCKDPPVKPISRQDIVLAYKKENDLVTPASITISHRKDDSRLLKSMLTNYGDWLIICAVLFFFILQILLMRNIIKKIFLLEYFDYDSSKEPDQHWINQFYATLPLNAKSKAFFRMGNNTLTNKGITGLEEECIENMRSRINTVGSAIRHNESEDDNITGVLRKERILHIQYILTPAYDAVWKALTPSERYVLFDFALDGLTNYKNMDIVYSLYQRGLFRKKDCQLELMSYSFRNYLLGKIGTRDIYLLEQRLNTGSTWKNLRNIFFVVLLAILIFLFATQQDVSNRILIIVSGLATLVPGILKIFDQNFANSGGQAAPKK